MWRATAVLAFGHFGALWCAKIPIAAARFKLYLGYYCLP
jgi:hypothetical protein